MVEDERDRADLVAADSFEYACAGLQSLRRLYQEEQCHTKKLQDDYKTLKLTCSEHITKLGLDFKQKEAEVERVRSVAPDLAMGATLSMTQRRLADTTARCAEAVRARQETVAQQTFFADELDVARKELAANRKVIADLRVGLKRMMELRDWCKVGETRAKEEVAGLKDKVSRTKGATAFRHRTDCAPVQLKRLVEERKKTEQALDDAKHARHESVRLLNDSMAEAKKTEDVKKESEDKVRSLEEKVATLEADLEKAKAGESVHRRIRYRGVLLMCPDEGWSGHARQ